MDGILSVLVSDKACEAVSELSETGMKLLPGCKVTLDGQSATLVGAARSKLWFQLDATGELAGYGRESIATMKAAEALVPKSEGKPTQRPELAAELREQLVKVDQGQGGWSLKEDVLLREWVEVVAAREGVLPVNLAVDVVLRAKESFAAYALVEEGAKQSRLPVPDLLRRAGALVAAKGAAAVLVRVSRRVDMLTL